MKARLILLAAITIGFVACKKKNKNGPIPFIYFESMAPNRVKASSPKDTVFITFKISDGDADLGNDPQSGNHDIYMIDTRVDQINPYYFPSIPTNELDAKEGFVGHCTVAVSAALFLQLRNDTHHLFNDTLQYKIFIKDKAGHNSDTITTPPIYLY